MKFKMIHENYNVSDLDRSIKFYNEALEKFAEMTRGSF
jgi:lactoylglutathione lyase